MKHQAGFTLLEVLVALAVLAIAMSAIIHAATQSIQGVTALREQTMASWVALNQVNQLLLDSKPWPAEGSRAGKAELGGRTWRWEARFAKTEDPDLRRVEMIVRGAENAPELSKLLAFRAVPPKKKPPAKPLDPAGQQLDPAGQQPTPPEEQPAS